MEQTVKGVVGGPWWTSGTKDTKTRTKRDMLSVRSCKRRERVTYMLKPGGGGAGISARCSRLAPGAAKAIDARTRSEMIVLYIFVRSVDY